MTQNPDLSLKVLREMMLGVGVRQLLMKVLAANDNSKNQLYFGSSLELLNILPMGIVTSERSASGKKGLKAPISLFWLKEDGKITSAPGAQLILYPQYPEIRLSGFLKGVKNGPNDLMTVRKTGRLLFLGITIDRKIIGWVADSDSRLAHEVAALGELQKTGIFQHIPIGTADTSRNRLMKKLKQIYLSGWINSHRLDGQGNIHPCASSNCGGLTLEAQFGIIPNSKAEPDFEGWEIKGHVVSDFQKVNVGQLTLMTPEPTGGIYCSEGVEAFVRKYGYADTKGRANRFNFSSPHRFGVRNEKTGLKLQFFGFDAIAKKITDPEGGFTLVDKNGRQAATWYFASLIEHWNRKHAKAAYVPYQSRLMPKRQYHYGNLVRIAEDTDFIRFLHALFAQIIIYDPGIKLEYEGKKARTKRRSQFRVRSSSLGALYDRFEKVDISK